METFSVHTGSRTHFVNITSEIQSAVEKLGIQDGIVTAFIPHTTSGITINENADPDVTADMEIVLDRAVPWTDYVRGAAKVLIDDGVDLAGFDGLLHSLLGGPFDDSATAGAQQGDDARCGKDSNGSLHDETPDVAAGTRSRPTPQGRSASLSNVAISAVADRNGQDVVAGADVDP